MGLIMRTSRREMLSVSPSIVLLSSLLDDLLTERLPEKGNCPTCEHLSEAMLIVSGTSSFLH